MSESIELLERRLARDLGRCIKEHDLISDGDKVMVCLSGGKDSYTLLHLLERAQAKSQIKFDLLAVHLDQAQPGYDGRLLRQWLEQRSVPFHIVRKDTYSVVLDQVPEGKTYCSVCSRLRRGILYNLAEEMGCDKIALGHHRDDAIETLMMNMMFNGSLSAMPAKWLTLDKRNTVIRPMIFIGEKEIAQFAEAMNFPILPCNLCGSQENLWRQNVKQLLGDLEKKVPHLRNSMLAAMKHVHGTHLLDPTIATVQGVAKDQAGGKHESATPSVRRLPLIG